MSKLHYFFNYELEYQVKAYLFISIVFPFLLGDAWQLKETGREHARLHVYIFPNWNSDFKKSVGSTTTNK